MRKAKALIRELFVPRVDLVRRPANRIPFLLLKQEEEEVKGMPQETMKTEGGPTTVAPEAVEQIKALAPEDTEKIKEALKLLWPLWENDVIPDHVIAALGTLVGYPLPPGVSYPKPYPSPYPQAYPNPGSYPKPMTTGTIEQPEASVLVVQASDSSAETLGEIAKNEKPSGEGSVKEELGKEEPMKEEIIKAEQKIAELQKALEEERTLREKKEFFAEIEKSLPNLTKLETQLGEVLFSLKKSSPERAEALLKLLQKLEAVLPDTPIFKELGSAEPAEPDPWKILDEKAAELIAKGEAKSLEQARVKVLSKDRELWKLLRGR